MQLIPLWLKVAYSVYVAVLVPFYTRYWGVGNFLWFSNVALLTTVASLWLESPRLAGMMALAVLVPETGWAIDFIIGLFVGRSPLGLARYMFEPQHPLYMRALSLYHLFLPPLLVWLVYRLGYDRGSLLAQTLFGWAMLLASYALTDPADNVNWVRGPGDEPQRWMPAPLWLLIVLAGFPLAFYLPTHALLAWLFPPPPR